MHGNNRPLPSWCELESYEILDLGEGREVAQTRSAAPGDCVAIGMGHHHDFPLVDPVKAVFFETTLQGAKRVGHLWTHTHGAPGPEAGRV